MGRAGAAIQELFTGPDGKTHDPARWLWIIGVLAFLGFTGYHIYKTGIFSMMDFGIAYATLLGGGAAGVKIKESTEPRGYDSDGSPTFNPPQPTYGSSYGSTPTYVPTRPIYSRQNKPDPAEPDDPSIPR